LKFLSAVKTNKVFLRKGLFTELLKHQIRCCKIKKAVCLTSSFAYSLRYAQILILGLFLISLRLKFSQALKINNRLCRTNGFRMNFNLQKA